jgi:hypothetical protein
MNELGNSAGDCVQPGAMGEVTQPMTNVAAGLVRRRYAPPAIVEFGSVQEFTRGSGSSATLDGRRSTRVRGR